MASQDQYRYSYSGSDVRAYVYFPGRSDLIRPLESLHTISWSIHEGKGQARSFGFKGIRGFAKGIRTIAGSLVATVIEDNPLSPLMDLASEISIDPAIRWNGWSVDWQSVGIGSGLNSIDFNRRLATTLPPFNLLIQFVSEGTLWNVNTKPEVSLSFNGAAVLIEGIEFIDETSTISIADAAMESPYTFVAKDCKTLSAVEFQRVISNPDSGDLLNKENELYNTIRSKLNQDKIIYNQFTANPNSANRIPE